MAQSLKLTGSVRAYPARALVVGYVLLILFGTGLLSLPFAHVPDSEPWRLSDAAFTATSAACVTGLIVRSTPNDFTLFGQVVILVLIQLGGLGIMTFATLAATALRGSASLRDKAATSATLGNGYHGETLILLRRVVTLVFSFELIAAGVLAWYGPGETIIQRLWWGLFHSVSAFCNAGFALQDDSLVGMANNVPLCLVMAGLIIIGGLGFPVLWDVGRRLFSRRNRHAPLSFHSRIVLVGTFILLAGGFACFWLIENNNFLEERTYVEAFTDSFFQSVTARTAGFNSVPLTDLTVATLFMIMFLMYIGAGPCSTGGGIKVSTFMVLLLTARDILGGGDRTEVFHRRLGRRTVLRAVTATLLYGVAAMIGLLLILFIEERNLAYADAQTHFLDAVFEVVSALGTVGLSTGLTSELSEPSRWVIMALMFIGRVAPLSLVIAITTDFREPRIKYPEGEVIIG